MDNTKQDILNKIGRPINCLVSEDRQLKKKSIETITQTLKEIPNDTLRHEILSDHILKNFMLVIADKSESIREQALNHLFIYIDSGWFQEKDVDHVVKSLEERIVSNPFKETTEELRVMVVTAFHKLCTDKLKSTLQHNLNIVTRAISNVMTDKNPETKKISAQCYSQYCRMFKDKIGLFGKNIIMNICQNLNHSHSRVRKPTIMCLFDLLMCDYGSSMMRDFPDVFNILIKISMDKNDEIKNIIVEKLIEYQKTVGHTDLQEVEYYILTIFLLIKNYDNIENFETKLNEFSFKRVEIYQERDEKVKESMDKLKEKFVGIVGDTGFAYTLVLFTHFKDKIIDLLSEKYLFWWTHIPFQIVFLKTIQHYFKFTHDSLEIKKVSNLFDNINKYFNVDNLNQKKADDYELITEICNTYAVIGQYYTTQNILNIIIYSKNKTDNKDYIEYNITLRVKAYVMLRYLLKNKPELKNEQEELGVLIKWLAKESYTDMDPTTSISLVPNYYYLLDMMADMGEDFTQDYILTIFDCVIRCHAILNIYKEQLWEAFDSPIADTQERIVEVYKKKWKYSIYEKYINEKLEEIIDSHQDWNKYSHNFYTFCDLIKSCGEYAILYIDKFMLPMCFVCVNYKDLEIRQYVLEIVDYICRKYGLNYKEKLRNSSPSSPKEIMDLIENEYDENEMYRKIVDFGFIILTQVVFTTLAWKPGKALYSLRKSSLILLRSLINNCVVNHMNFGTEMRGEGGKESNALHEMYILVSSSLDEDYGYDARILATSALAELFVIIRLDYNDCFLIYDKILKRLDDSHDAVRVLGCQALQQMFIAAHDKFTSSPLEYCVKTMLVHLDDQNTEVYEGVRMALSTLFKVMQEKDERDVYQLLCNAENKNYNKYRISNLKEAFIKQRGLDANVVEEMKVVQESTDGTTDLKRIK